MNLLFFILVAGASGSPHFIARQAKTSKGVTVEQRNRWREQCQAACGADVDSSCSPQCEAEMFTCQDHDQPQEAQKLADCEAGVLTRYKNFGEEWNATHFVLTHGGRNTAAATEEFASLCKAACGASADSSCVPQCETELYACLDHNSIEQADARESCKQEVLNRYKDFVSNWNATHFFQKRLSTERAAVRGQCEAICGPTVDSDCAIKCEVEMYACLDHNSIEEADARQKCVADVAAKFGNYDASHSKDRAVQLVANKANHIASLKARSHELCISVCTKGLEVENSLCVTPCETEMYKCLALGDDAAEEKKCSEEVAAKYRSFHAANVTAGGNETKAAGNDTKVAAPASFMARRVASAVRDDPEEMDSHALCAHFCTDHVGMEPEDSYCTTDCRAAMYRCVSLGSKDLRSTCRSEVEAKYAPAAAPAPSPAGASPAAASPAASA